MPALTIEDTFLSLQNRIKSILSRAFQLKNIGAEELLAILFVLKQANNENELACFTDIFSNSFPILQEIPEEKKEIELEDMEQKVRKALSKIVRTDPLKATEIAKATLKPGITWEELLNRFPELKD